MPCYRCGARQSDPEQGKPSPWKRGVRREHQVLICPDCAAAAVAELDRCSGCGGTHLIRRLDQVECLTCGLVREADPAREANPAWDADPARGAGAHREAEPAAETGTTVKTEPSPPQETAPSSSPPSPPVSPLADEVARALDRLLGRG